MSYHYHLTPISLTPISSLSPDPYISILYRSGSYGEIINGKYRERLRIDPATMPGKKGPGYSHYHIDGRGTHYSPRTGDKDIGF